ncbi:chemotaxis protein CheA [Coriobacteriia bacterium Es71-Z0120]|uniref:chemotaxis protein CheA n=1 Tax=Parvivirga hydrogeniphila TaxID=2939460 RepID=UPI0022608299|nr:chemotaxis protein CheA [Parvivirga hydrogeniphila]MCL4078473.1 chemotaxis protein CheA [Parvivirga hydrogeniphila]
MSDDMSAYKEVFLSESAEYLQAITDGLIALEADPHDLEPVETVFRGAHSLKGMAAAMGYDRTADLTHKMESLMDTIRKREQAIDSDLVDLMLRAVDAVRELIADESEGRSTYDAAPIIADLIARTERGKAVPVETESASGPKPAEAPPSAGGEVYRVSVTIEPTSVLKSVRAYMALKRLGHMGTVLDTEPSARDIEDERFDRTFVAVLQTVEPPEAIERAVLGISEIESVQVAVDASRRPTHQAAQQEAGAETRRVVPKLSETQTVRVSIGHLDAMVNLVGELVILRARLERIARERDDHELSETVAALDQISAELQHEVMQTRMVPVGNIFNRFPRMVRDLARDLGKQVDFEMTGLDIELDRTVLDEIGDPIVHLLRNAVDHGIEGPEERQALGKPPRGHVRLSAERDRDQVRISVSDDGRGMDIDRIWQKAVERGLVSAGERDAWSEEEVLMLTCAPGFSTAEKTTSVSGRGVGMDVVKGKIEYLGGTIAIRSERGKGLEISLSLPLTLAIVPALLVGTSEQVYALPLSAVTEVLSTDEVRTTTVDAAPCVVLRDGAVVPVWRLDQLLSEPTGRRRKPREKDHIVLVESAGLRNALAVERLVARQEVVIKPLSPLFKGIRGLGGATVLGDGSVALILDPRTLFGRGGVRA